MAIRTLKSETNTHNQFEVLFFFFGGGGGLEYSVLTIVFDR